MDDANARNGASRVEGLCASRLGWHSSFESHISARKSHTGSCESTPIESRSGAFLEITFDARRVGPEAQEREHCQTDEAEQPRERP
ncbi:MAG: hypothetical protein Rubg2KO_12150 [Rubricoccaceae bacterium]